MNVNFTSFFIPVVAIQGSNTGYTTVNVVVSGINALISYPNANGCSFYWLAVGK